MNRVFRRVRKILTVEDKLGNYLDKIMTVSEIRSRSAVHSSTPPHTAQCDVTTRHSTVSIPSRAGQYAAGCSVERRGRRDAVGVMRLRVSYVASASGRPDHPPGPPGRSTRLTRYTRLPAAAWWSQRTQLQRRPTTGPPGIDVHHHHRRRCTTAAAGPRDHSCPDLDPPTRRFVPQQWDGRRCIVSCGLLLVSGPELTCHMGSHSVTCHPAELTFPPLPQAAAGTRLSEPGGMQG